MLNSEFLTPGDVEKLPVNETTSCLRMLDALRATLTSAMYQVEAAEAAIRSIKPVAPSIKGDDEDGPPPTFGS